MDPKEFGLFLKGLRNKAGYTLTELGDRIGYSNPYLSQIETGKKGIPSPNLLKKLAEPLEVSYGFLLSKAGYIDIAEFQNLYDELKSSYVNTAGNFDSETESDIQLLLAQIGKAIKTQQPEEAVNQLLDLNVLLSRETNSKTSILRKVKEKENEAIKLPSDSTVTYKDVKLTDNEKEFLYDFIEILIKNRVKEGD